MINKDTIRQFLEDVGRACLVETDLFLLGGVAMNLLGETRFTVDIDYVADCSARQSSFV